MEPVIVFWSGGKDSALALHTIQQAGNYEIAALLTTVSEDDERISMHGVRRSLLEQQAAMLGLPLEVVPMPPFPSNAVYLQRLRRALQPYAARGVRTVVFGDLFLADLRAWREAQFAEMELRCVFPLWGRDTAALAREFVRLGFKAVTVCVDGQTLDRAIAGRLFDAAFLAELPPEVDPCGENGEFHTFVWDGPNFKAPVLCVPWTITLQNDRFWLCDLLPER
jgi:uncharacterized protein (TIGR00290 family)